MAASRISWWWWREVKPSQPDEETMVCFFGVTPTRGRLSICAHALCRLHAPSLLAAMQPTWLAALLMAAGAAAAAPPAPPPLPSAFSLGYNFTLPYTRSFQPHALTYVVTMAQDGSHATQRTNGDVVLTVHADGSYSETAPRIDALACTRYAADDESDALLHAPVVPDVGGGGWVYIGEVAASTFDDAPLLSSPTAHAWRLTADHGARTVNYTFWSDAATGAPVALHQEGPDLLSGSHFDEYKVSYTSFDPNPPPASAFDEPDECARVPPPEAGNGGLRPRRSGGAGAAVVPSFGRRAVCVTAPTPGRAYTTTLTPASRPWLSDAEFAAMMLRPKQARGLMARATPSARLPHVRRLPKGAVPAAVDWRGTPAAGVVKDQATCGSCWAFGTNGALESAIAVATGRNHSFSEQALMDCSWNYGTNSACGGGDADAALDWLVAEGGGVLDLEAEYEYQGAAGYCRHKTAGGGGDDDDDDGATNRRHHRHRVSIPRVIGYAFTPPGDDETLMEAVASRGPLQVSIDAAAHGFRYYASGVYDEPTCHADEDNLDHSVTLVGYGTDEETGIDWWLIKNSWSQHWGDGGYVKIARARGGCGVATAAMYAVVEEDDDRTASA